MNLWIVWLSAGVCPIRRESLQSLHEAVKVSREKHPELNLRGVAVLNGYLAAQKHGTRGPLPAGFHWHVTEELRSSFALGMNTGAKAAKGAVEPDVLVMLQDDFLLPADPEIFHRLCAQAVGSAGVQPVFNEPDESGAMRLIGPFQIDQSGMVSSYTCEDRVTVKAPGYVVPIAADYKLFTHVLAGFDVDYWPSYYEDTDYSFRAHRLGLPLRLAQDVVIEHRRSSTADKLYTPVDRNTHVTRNRALFLERHKELLPPAPPARIHPVAPPPSDGFEAVARKRKVPRLLVISDSPAIKTGFGIQSNAIIQAGRAAGFDVHFLATSMVQKTKLPPPYEVRHGVPIWHCSLPLGNEHLGFVLNHVRPDYIATLTEIWMADSIIDYLGVLAPRMASWLTCESPEAEPDYFKLLSMLHRRVFMSEFGLRSHGAEAEKFPHKAGKTLHVPHGVNGDVFRIATPELVKQWRANLNVPDDGFLVFHNGQNQKRKNTVGILHAWQQFVQWLPAGERGKVKLLLGTQPKVPILPADDIVSVRAIENTINQGGWDLGRMMERVFSAEERKTVAFAPKGYGVTDDVIAAQYNAAHVHLLPSLAEGFGVPLIEAMACGRSNIASDNSTTPEICGEWGIRLECDEWNVEQSTGIVRPYPSAKSILKGLQEAYGLREALDLPAYREGVRSHALSKYAWNGVVDRWADILRDVRKEFDL